MTKCIELVSEKCLRVWFVPGFSDGGKNPNISTADMRTTERIGLLTTNHSMSDIRARIKNSVSDRVIGARPFRIPSNAIRSEMSAAASVTHAPAPA